MKPVTVKLRWHVIDYQCDSDEDWRDYVWNAYAIILRNFDDNAPGRVKDLRGVWIDRNYFFKDILK